MTRRRSSRGTEVVAELGRSGYSDRPGRPLLLPHYTAIRDDRARGGTHPRTWTERYSGTIGSGASGCDALAERSIAMAAYAMTPVTTQRISVR